MDRTPVVRPATLDDLPRIASIQCARDVAGTRTPSEDGFLVSAFSEDDYRRFLDEADHFYVVETEAGVAAFVLAYSSERIGEHETVGRALAARVAAPFVLMKQVAVAHAATGRGHARRLYAHVLAHAYGRPGYAAIVLEPENTASIRFHERLGFERVLEVVGDDGARRGLWALAGTPPAT